MDIRELLKEMEDAEMDQSGEVEGNDDEEGAIGALENELDESLADIEVDEQGENEGDDDEEGAIGADEEESINDDVKTEGCINLSESLIDVIIKTSKDIASSDGTAFPTSEKIEQ